MQRFVVLIRFLISLNACVPGCHLLVRRTAGPPRTLRFPPGCGTIHPPGVGLKNLPFEGLSTVKSSITNNNY